MNLSEILETKIEKTIRESLESSYSYKTYWEEDADFDPQDYDEEDEVPPGAKMARLQKAHFTTEDGTKYGWYAKQNRYEYSHWEIVFGIIDRETDDKTSLNIKKSGTGREMRVFSTVLEILSNFVEYFEDDVHYVYFTADTEQGNNRARLYRRFLQRYKPDNFELVSEDNLGNEIAFTLQRRY